MVVADDSSPSQYRDSADDTTSTVDNVLRETQYLYAVVLLIAFIVCAAWYSVFNAKKEEDLIQSDVKGPGGKPLPITKRKKRNDGERKIGPCFGRPAKIAFRYLAAMVFLSYVASGSFMFIHAFRYEDPYSWAKEGLPWAGEWTVVRAFQLFDLMCTISKLVKLTSFNTGSFNRVYLLLSVHLVLLV